jgi:hypothetical protein
VAFIIFVFHFEVRKLFYVQPEKVPETFYDNVHGSYWTSDIIVTTFCLILISHNGFTFQYKITFFCKNSNSVLLLFVIEALYYPKKQEVPSNINFSHLLHQ